MKFPGDPKQFGFKGNPDEAMWRDFFRAQYPRWDDWCAFRAEEMDPGNVFMNQYWAAVFGVDTTPHAQRQDGPWKRDDEDRKVDV